MYSAQVRYPRTSGRSPQRAARIRTAVFADTPSNPAKRKPTPVLPNNAPNWAKKTHAPGQVEHEQAPEVQQLNEVSLRPKRPQWSGSAAKRTHQRRRQRRRLTGLAALHGYGGGVKVPNGRIKIVRRQEVSRDYDRGRV